MSKSYCVVVEWKNYVGLKPFEYFCSGLEESMRLFRLNCRRPEAAKVSLILPN